MDSYPKATRRMAVIAAIALVALPSSLAGQVAKRPGQEAADTASRRPEPAAALAGSLAILLRDPAVHAELELTTGQLAALEAAMAEIDGAGASPYVGCAADLRIWWEASSEAEPVGTCRMLPHEGHLACLPAVSSPVRTRLPH